MTDSARLFSRILVPIDDSEPARAALELALELALRYGAKVTVCTAIDTRVIVDLNEIVRDQAQALLDAARETALARGVAVDLQVLAGTASAIAEYAREQRAESIVMGTHGRRGIAGAILGSTTAGVLAASTIPVLVTKAGVRAHVPFGRILVAVDDSDPSDAAVALAAHLAVAERDAVVFCSAVDGDAVAVRAASCGYDVGRALEDEAEQARARIAPALAAAHARGLDATGTVVTGTPARAIVQAARDAQAGLIAIGSHGRRGLQRLVLGSVAGAVVRESGVPVLVVRAKHRD